MMSTFYFVYIGPDDIFKTRQKGKTNEQTKTFSELLIGYFYLGNIPDY